MRLRLELFCTLVAWPFFHSTSRAELWPTLENYVGRCVLIVKAKTVVDEDGQLTFKVLESWKGKYDPSIFCRTTRDGRFFATQGEHGVNVRDGQEIIFFFTRHNQPVEGKLDRHSTAFPIREGKVVYAATNYGLRKEYTVADFEKVIRSLVNPESK